MPSAKTTTTYKFTMADLAVALNSIGIPFQKGDTIDDTDGGGWLWTYEDSGESLVLEHITEEVSVQPTAPAKPEPTPAEPAEPSEPSEPSDLEKAKAKYPVGTKVEIAGAGRFWRPVIITGYEEDRYGSPAVVYSDGGWDRVKTILDPGYCRPYVESVKAPEVQEPLPRLVQVGDYIVWPYESGVYRVTGEGTIVGVKGTEYFPDRVVVGKTYSGICYVRLGQPLPPYIKFVKVLVPTKYKTTSADSVIYECVPPVQYDGGNIDRVAVGAYSRGKMCKVVDLCLEDNLFDTCSDVIPDLTDYVVLPDQK